jgi:hypothetical protein
MPLESCENDRSQGTPLPPSKPIYHDVDLTKVGDALRHQVSGALVLFRLIQCEEIGLKRRKKGLV